MSSTTPRRPCPYRRPTSFGPGPAHSLERCGVVLCVRRCRTARRRPLADHRRGSVRRTRRGSGGRAGRDRRRPGRVPAAGARCPRRSAARSSSASARCSAEHKADIAELVTIEAGKIPSEALGEVQEMIDICDFAVGLSRQLEGRTMPSERPEPPPDGDVASARRRRGDLGLQFPRRRVVLEHRDRARMRRQRRLEALADDAADLDGVLGAARPRRARSPARPRGCTSSCRRRRTPARR